MIFFIPDFHTSLPLSRTSIKNIYENLYYNWIVRMGNIVFINFHFPILDITECVCVCVCVLID